MPTYDYHCAKCSSTYELREGFDAPTTHRCQECGKGTAKRVLHAPRVVFKGSGWYVTDSRQKSTAINDSEPASADSAASETKTEAKAEKKKESPKAESKPAPKESSDTAAAAAS
jgi:putative FmdB family regulatory protein